MMKNIRYKKELFGSGLVFLVFGLLVYLETQLPFFKKFLPIGENKLIVVILNINLLLILLLLFLIARTIIKNYVEKKRGIWGSRLKTKLTFTLLFISIIPSFTLFVLSTSFFNISMERWFSQKIEDTLDNALEISQFYYDDLFQRYEKIGTNIAKKMIRLGLHENNVIEMERFLKRQTQAMSFQFYSVLDPSGNVVKSNMPENIDSILSSRIRSGEENTIRLIMPLRRGEIVISGTRLYDNEGSMRGTFFIGNTIRLQGTQRLKDIASVYKEFKESRSFKKILKYSFILPLFLSTIITIFFSVWVGIKIAAGIVTPIEKVKEGTSIIAKGKFDINLEEKGGDEIGTLVAAFNSMARELKVAKEELEEKSRYIEVILNNVATGIISTDNKGNIVLLNRAAKIILGAEGEEWIGRPLKKVFGSELKQEMKTFLREAKAASDNRSIVKEVRIRLKKDITFLRASLTVLKDEEGMAEGFIIAFDDITHFARAEKLATWREIAKKLTHEIKNPLTPIILSAERIRRKVLGRSDGKDRDILDETTSIIIRSVEEIKNIVNELTKLTLISRTKTLEDINNTIEEVIDIYNNLYPNIVFNFKGSEMPLCRIDKDGFRRAIINLITNAAKAVGDKQGEINITTGFEQRRGIAVIKVTDNGDGIPDEDKDKIFDPYFTKDKDGTGLGLSIVQSIILEHYGRISVEDNSPKGACFIIEIPVIET